MSEEMQHEDALEQRLRAHYASELGQPPSLAETWTLLQDELLSTPRREPINAPAVQWYPAPARPFPPLPTSVHQTHAFRLRSVLSIVAAALLVALFAMVLLHPFGRTSGTTTTTTSDTPLPAGFTVHVLAPDEIWTGTSLADLQMLSTDEGWAVGSRDITTRDPVSHKPLTNSESLILHYTHGKWTASRDVFPYVNLTSISMLSATDGWASGWAPGSASGGVSTSQFTPILLHYSGGHWTSVQAPGQGEIDNLSMLSPRDGWAIQKQMSPDVSGPYSFRTTLLHYDGTAWSTADTGDMSLLALAMLSPSEGWATGMDGVIARFQNDTWTRWPTPAPGDISTIAMVSPTDGWMAGVAPGYSADPKFQKPHHLFMLHYNGHDWQPVTLPALPNLLTVYPSAPHPQNNTGTSSTDPGSFGDIAMASPEEGWASGDFAGGASVLYHYSDGKWHLYPFGVNATLGTIRMVSAGEGWEIGGKYDFVSNREDTVILHYTNGSWTIYKP